MCLNPITLANGQQVACLKCWQCIRNKIDDWTGRCIAERHASAGAHSVTLTYGRDDRYDSTDHIRAAALTYSDVQKMLKLMRRHGLKVRYFIVGEYGATKGRSHWHCLFFWPEVVPIMPMLENTEWRFWPHGHTYWEPLTADSVRYVCKYIAKELETDDRQYHKGMSRTPPLGDAYFRALADMYVADRLAPQDFIYSFPEVRDKADRQKRFVMRGVTRENFLRYFRDGWWSRYGDHPPNSEILESFEDLETKAGSSDEAQRVLAAEKVGVLRLSDVLKGKESTYRVEKPKVHQLMSWMQQERLVFSELLNVWLYKFDGEQRPWYWAKNEHGVYGWRTKIGVGGVVESNKPKQSYQSASRG